MPASHFDVKAMTGRPKFIVRHSTEWFLLHFDIDNCLLKKFHYTYLQ
jgi:hypothetical protein